MVNQNELHFLESVMPVFQLFWAHPNRVKDKNLPLLLPCLCIFNVHHNYCQRFILTVALIRPILSIEDSTTSTAGVHGK